MGSSLLLSSISAPLSSISSFSLRGRQTGEALACAAQRDLGGDVVESAGGADSEGDTRNRAGGDRDFYGSPTARGKVVAVFEVELRQTRIKHPSEMQGQEAATGTRHRGQQADAWG